MLLVDSCFAQICINSSTCANTLKGAMAPEGGAMAGHRSQRMVNITTTPPIPLLERIGDLVHEGKVPSSSYLIREAVRKYLEPLDRTIP